MMDAYNIYFDQVILNNPWRDEGADSQVYEEKKSGKITGFLR